jgi:hypothetical protein
MTRRASALLLAVLATSCAAPLMKLPQEPGVPASDGVAILAQATMACRGIQTLSAEISVGGRVGGRGMRRARLLVGVRAPASVYLDAPAPFGASAFIFAAVDDQGTLLLPRDRRVLERGRPAEVLEAITGVPLSPFELRQTLTGCAPALDAAEARQVGDQWRIIRAASEWYLYRARPDQPWRLVAAVHRGGGREWRVEYREFRGDLPRALRLSSADANGFDLTITLADLDLNVPLEPDIFRPRVPAGYAPISLEDLRRAGPMAEQSPRE